MEKGSHRRLYIMSSHFTKTFDIAAIYRRLSSCNNTGGEDDDVPCKGVKRVPRTGSWRGRVHFEK